jgi:hypothetical protein
MGREELEEEIEGGVKAVQKKCYVHLDRKEAHHAHATKKSDNQTSKRHRKCTQENHQGN